MGLLKNVLIVGTIGLLFNIMFYQNLVYEIGGTVEPGFEQVREVFKKNFDDGLEGEGSTFAVCHDGKLVVDLWGGYSDSDADRPWRKDTLTIVFSVTKSVSALCLAILVDRGLLSYDDPVIKHWPEFGKNGKEKTTVKMIASHEAGLVALDEQITFETIRDWKKMSQLFEDQKPNWEVGTETGYHILTYGWLIDQLIRRVDPKKRSLGQFFDQEIAKPHGIDFYIGLPPELEYRVARLTRPSIITTFLYAFDFDVIDLAYKIYSQNYNSIMKRALNNPSWTMTGPDITYNNPDMHALEIGSATGIGTARAIAKLFCLVDSGKIINRTTRDILLEPVWIDTVESTMHTTLTCGWGFYHTQNPDGNYQIGHPGYGGQYAKYDPHHKLSFAYLRNELIYTGEDFQAKSFVNLEKSVYNVLLKTKKINHI